jgi:hypothetical protein
MKAILAPCLAAFAVCLMSGGPGYSQSTSPSTPTTRILAIGTLNPGVDMAAVRTIMPTEVRDTVKLYLSGKIDQWYWRQDHFGVVFLLNLTDTAAAKEMLEGLPLAQAHMITFEQIPLAPLSPLRLLPGIADETPHH